MSTRILIADDEELARSRLRRLLEESDEYEVVGEAVNGSDALQFCVQQSPDVVLLDIRMPEMDGIETARHLSRMEDGPAVIFTTAFDSHAMEAFDTHAIGYLLKPVRQDRLERALGFASRLARPQFDAFVSHQQEPVARQNICVRRGQDLHLIPIEHILFFQADRKYITVRHKFGTDLIDEPLKDLAGEFADRFIRIHRNALVALSWVDRLEKSAEGQYLVYLRDCREPLPVSRRHVTDVKACVRHRA